MSMLLALVPILFVFMFLVTYVAWKFILTPMYEQQEIRFVRCVPAPPPPRSGAPLISASTFASTSVSSVSSRQPHLQLPQPAIVAHTPTPTPMPRLVSLQQLEKSAATCTTSQTCVHPAFSENDQQPTPAPPRAYISASASASVSVAADTINEEEEEEDEENKEEETEIIQPPHPATIVPDHVTSPIVCNSKPPLALRRPKFNLLPQLKDLAKSALTLLTAPPPSCNANPLRLMAPQPLKKSMRVSSSSSSSSSSSVSSISSSSSSIVASTPHSPPRVKFVPHILSKKTPVLMKTTMMFADTTPPHPSRHTNHDPDNHHHHHRRRRRHCPDSKSEIAKSSQQGGEKEKKGDAEGKEQKEQPQTTLTPLIVSRSPFEFINGRLGTLSLVMPQRAQMLKSVSGFAIWGFKTGVESFAVGVGAGLFGSALSEVFGGDDTANALKKMGKKLEEMDAKLDKIQDTLNTLTTSINEVKEQNRQTQSMIADFVNLFKDTMSVQAYTNAFIKISNDVNNIDALNLQFNDRITDWSFAAHQHLLEAMLNSSARLQAWRAEVKVKLPVALVSLERALGVGTPSGIESLLVLWRKSVLATERGGLFFPRFYSPSVLAALWIQYLELRSWHLTTIRMLMEVENSEDYPSASAIARYKRSNTDVDAAARSLLPPYVSLPENVLTFFIDPARQVAYSTLIIPHPTEYRGRWTRDQVNTYLATTKFAGEGGWQLPSTAELRELLGSAYTVQASKLGKGEQPKLRNAYDLMTGLGFDLWLESKTERDPTNKTLPLRFSASNILTNEGVWELSEYDGVYHPGINIGFLMIRKQFAPNSWS